MLKNFRNLPAIVLLTVFSTLNALPSFSDETQAFQPQNSEFQFLETPPLETPSLELPQLMPHDVGAADGGAIGTIGSPQNQPVTRVNPPSSQPSSSNGPVVIIDGSIFLQPQDPISVCQRNYGGSQRLESALEACQGFEACIKNDRFNRLGCFDTIFNLDAKKNATASWKAVCFDKCKKARKFPSERPENCFADCYR